MAIVKVQFFSNALLRTVPFTAVIPNDGAIYPGQKPSFAIGDMKTLYLLHGVMGDETDYLMNTRIRELSEKYKVAVIMPAGENRFYLDDVDGLSLYGKYIGEELVEYTRRTFHLSPKREDTFIGGLSMGGYGAMRNGLVYGDTFSRICSFSGAYVVFRIVDAGGRHYEDPVFGAAYQRRIFGDPKTMAERDIDPRETYLRRKSAGKEIPEIFMTEGTEDFLIDVNHTLRDFFMEHDEEITYIEDKGSHDWNFWNKHLEDAFRWLTLQKE